MSDKKNLRWKLANWISGGALAFAENRADMIDDAARVMYMHATPVFDALEEIAAIELHRNVGGKEARQAVRIARKAMGYNEGPVKVKA